MKDNMEWFKLVIGWVVATMHAEPQMKKPFNPILGETFQGSFGNYEIVVEQISHHPPVSAFQIFNPKQKKAPFIDGHFRFEASTGLRKLVGSKKGVIWVTFPDTKQVVEAVTFPKIEFHGMMKGTRTANFTGDIKVKDDKNGFYADLIVCPDKKGWFKKMFSSVKADKLEGIITNCRNLDFRDQINTDRKKLIKESDG